jgi:hypothetical protein
MCYQTLLTMLLVATATLRVLAADPFVDPPARFRILPLIYGLPDAPAARKQLLDKLKMQGFGGMVTNVSFDDYLQNDAHWQSFADGVYKAKQAGLALWLYDEHGYPSGNAAGLTMRGHPEWETRGLLVADRVVGHERATLDLPPGRLRRAVALPMVDGRVDLERTVDLSGSIRGRKLEWHAPDGRWQMMVITEDRLYEGTQAAVSNCDRLPYISLLQPEPTARFLAVTHEAYARRLGDNLGQWFMATFTDEPSLMSWFCRPQSYRPLPWSANLPVQFAKRRGYVLTDALLPALAADAGPRGARVRYDFWLTVSELVAENYFGQIREWCRRHRVPSGGHLLGEELLLWNVANNGDLFRCARMLDAPSVDCLTSLPAKVPWHIGRLISSAGELEGRPDVMCEISDWYETFRKPGDPRPAHIVTEDEIRGSCNRFIVSGITTITSAYTFNKITDEQLRRLNLWIGRTCMSLYGGRQVTDMAVVYPIESLWPKFEPSRESCQDVPEAGKLVDRLYRRASLELFTHNRDFSYVDARTLAEAQVGGGELRFRDLRWRVVVLPAVDTLPLAAWKNLAQFWRSGGVVVALGSVPTNSATEFPSPGVQALGKELFGTGNAPRCQGNPAGGLAVYLPPQDAIARLVPVLNAILDPQVRAADDTPVRSTHRQIAGRHVFFLINDGPQPWQGTVSLAATGAGEQLDPATGKITPVAGPANLRLALTPYGGTLFRFEKSRTPQRRKVAPHDVPAAAKCPGRRAAKLSPAASVVEASGG